MVWYGIPIQGLPAIGPVGTWHHRRAARMKRPAAVVRRITAQAEKAARRERKASEEGNQHEQEGYRQGHLTISR